MNAPTPNLKASLWFSEGGSDKEYHAEVVAVDGGYLVNYRYGRRGSTLTCGCKTPAPVDIAQATKIFEKLVKEKTSKGYTPDESGSAYQGTEKAGLKTDFIPQLLNPISEDEAMRLIDDPDWVAQEKFDGERRGAHACDDGNVTGINRKGLSVPLTQAIADELKRISMQSGAIRVDGEQIGDILYVFDLHVKSGTSRRDLPFRDRIVLAQVALQDCKNIKVVPVAETSAEKRALWDKVKANKGEGVVFKRHSAHVKEGRPASGGDWLKFKFTESASCYVMEINSGKRSVKLGLLDNSGRTDVIAGQLMVSVGSVTIPANHDVPSVSDIVEVEYLYAYKGGSLFQPVYRGKRTDLDISACVTGQLKYKPEGREDEDA